MRALRFILTRGLLTLAFMALLLLAAYGTLQTRWGKERAEALLENQLNADIEGLSGTLPFAPRIESLTLKDAQGAWLTLKDVALDWSVEAMPLTWHVQRLEAGFIHWLRLPESEREASSGFSLPALPRMDIQRLAFPRIEIEKAVAGRRQLLAARGDIRTFAGTGTADSHFHLRTLEGPETALAITTRGVQAMTAEAVLTEEAGGIVGRMMGRAGQPLRVQAAMVLMGNDSMRIENAQLASGGLEAALTGTIGTPFDDPSFMLKGKATGLAQFSRVLASLAPGGISFDVEGEYGDEALRIASLRLQAEHAVLEGQELRLSGESIAGIVHVTIPEARHLQANLHGAFTADTKLGGTVSKPEARLSAIMRDEGRVLNLAALLQLDETRLRLSEIEGGTKGLKITGELVYDTHTALAEGRLMVDAGDLSGLNPFLAADVKGSGSAEVILAAANGKQRVEAKGTLEDVTYSDTGAAAATFRFHASDALALKGIDAEIEAAALRTGKTIIDTLTLSAQGSGASTQLALDAESETAPAFTLHSTGTLKTDLPEWTLTLNTFGGAGFALASPTTLTRKEERLTLSPIRVNVAGGSIEANGFYSASRVNLRLNAAKLPLGLFADNVYGMAKGTIHVTGTAAQPNAVLDARITELASMLKENGGFTLGITGTLAPESLTLRARVENTQGDIHAEARMPARFALSPFALAVPPEGKLSGSLYADAQIGPLLTSLLPPGQMLSGHAKGTLALRGTPASPWVEGALDLTGGRYENQTTGTTLEDMDIRLQAQRDRLDITRGSARAGDGRITLAGDIGLEAPNPFALRATLENAEIIDGREASGIVNGTVRLSGDITAPLIAGELVLGPMEIRLPESSGVEVPAVKILNPEAMPTQAWQTKERLKEIVLGPDNVSLNVTLRAPGRVYIRGRGLETEMRGEVSIGGTLGEPAIEGQLRTVRGAFTLLDRRLDITEGTLIFRGAMPPSPYVRMVAETDTGELTAGIRLEGPIRSPELSLTSTPARPEDEIMAHLLFGRELRSITPFQGIQLAQAIQTLRGKGGGMDLLGKARNLLGVDRLDVSETDNGDLGVGAGKYVSDKIYVGAEGGADPQAGKVKAEIEVSPRFSVETETGGRSSGVRFNWKRDY